MKKKLTALLLTMALLVPIAGTYQYKPVSSQPWYQSLQKDLNTIKTIKFSFNIKL